MKKLLFSLVCLSFIGCANPNRDTFVFTRNASEIKLQIWQHHNSNSITVEIKNAEEAKAYKERLKKIIKEIETYEEQLSIYEKN